MCFFFSPAPLGVQLSIVYIEAVQCVDCRIACIELQFSHEMYMLCIVHTNKTYSLLCDFIHRRADCSFFFSPVSAALIIHCSCCCFFHLFACFVYRSFFRNDTMFARWMKRDPSYASSYHIHRYTQTHIANILSHIANTNPIPMKICWFSLILVFDLVCGHRQPHTHNHIVETIIVLIIAICIWSMIAVPINGVFLQQTISDFKTFHTADAFNGDSHQ